MENKICIEKLENILNENREKLTEAISKNKQDEIIKIIDNIEALNQAISVLENLNPKTVIFIQLGALDMRKVNTGCLGVLIGLITFWAVICYIAYKMELRIWI